MSKRSKHILSRNGKSPVENGPGVPRSWLLASLLCWLIGGCATTPAPEGPDPVALPETDASATTLMARAGRTSADQAASLYLQAAWAFLEADDIGGAGRAFQALEPGLLDESDLPDYQLLAASLAIQRGDSAGARKAMNAVPRSLRSTPRAQRILSALCLIEQDYDCALKHRVSAAAGDPADNDDIWHLLGLSVSLADLTTSAGNSADADLTAWRSLQQAAIVPFSVAESQAAARTWLASHPEHPAALIPPAAITELLEQTARPQRVSLLLPLSGPLARAGEAVRDGFISASLIASATSRLTVTVYDSASEPLPILYERILADGTDLLIGPLQKTAVAELAALNPELPVLALNYMDDAPLSERPFTQFGLAIEDEAATIATRLRREGVERALLFHNYDDWSLRARRTLTDSNTVTLTVQPFTDVRTITESVGTAMHVESSQARHDELAALLRTDLEFLPRAREDVDAVVALIDNTEANALVPALRFHFAEHLPIYASSQITRRARAGQLQELEGFHVSELPYFLAGDAVFDTLAEPFNLKENPFASLMALGSDAFRIAERLEQQAPLVLLGSTGLLKERSDGRINRELAWGIIARGSVRPERVQHRPVIGAGD